MAVLGPIVEIAANFAAVVIAQFSHRCRIGAQPVGDDRFNFAMAFQRLLEKVQRCRFVGGLGNLLSRDLAPATKSAPKVMGLAVNLLEDIVNMPRPVLVAAHAADPLAANVGGEHRAKSIPAQPHRFVTNADAGS